MGRARFKLNLTVEGEGGVVADETTVKLLRLIESKGSLLSVARDLGLSYSTAWDIINRAERGLGTKLVSAKRGHGGGMKLTEDGKAFIERYQELRRRYIWSEDGTVCDVVYAGSDDLIVRELISELRGLGYCIDAYWVGSFNGLMMINMGLADIAGVHMLDPVSGEYNIPYLNMFGSWDRAVLIRGYLRLLGLVHKPHLEIKDLTEILGLRMVNRNPGSGTRLVMELLINAVAAQLGMRPSEVKASIRGYDDVVNTHTEVIDKVIKGIADYGIALAGQALDMGLAVRPLALEEFDFVVSRDSLRKPAVTEFIRKLSSLQPRPGYVLLRSTGSAYAYSK
ncbi:substrate-binding domain-containing protein [Vulcanisaeta thermophila]|uniref:substrate-binding domain-containing protein n=1 Tax=Vulcanisaeta thermophila TaxID=867917 RepID=UPI000853E46B|nr:substrate-binding domain-containing protein [Vulcanisaeta thermophila]